MKFVKSLDWQKINKVAVLGASNNPDKYGYKIVKKLMARGYELFPVNPRAGEVLGQKAYQKIEEIIDELDLVVIVIPPELAFNEVLKITNIRSDLPIIVQPGAESAELLAWLKNKDYMVYTQTCVMVLAENKSL